MHLCGKSPISNSSIIGTFIFWSILIFEGKPAVIRKTALKRVPEGFLSFYQTHTSILYTFMKWTYHFMSSVAFIIIWRSAFILHFSENLIKVSIADQPCPPWKIANFKNVITWSNLGKILKSQVVLEFSCPGLQDSHIRS